MMQIARPRVAHVPVFGAAVVAAAADRPLTDRPTTECLPSTHWLTTKSKVTRIEYRWEIANFNSKVCEGWKNIVGPTISPGGSDLQLTLEMLPDSDGFLCIKIAPREKRTTQVALYACIIDVNNERVCCMESAEEPDYFEVVGDGIRGRVIRRDKVVENSVQYLPENKLSVLCIIHYLEPGTYAADDVAEPIPIIPPADGSSFMGNILNEGLFTDVVVVVGKQEFPAHKAILAERTDVFRAMFNADMKESHNKHVVIEDMTADAVSDLLTFIYTDTAPNISESSRAEELLAAAEKYNIPRLKAICEAELAKCIDITNAIDMLIMSETHRADQLKRATLFWMARHAGDVVETESWKSLCQEHPELLKFVCKEFASYISALKQPAFERIVCSS